MNKVRPHIVLEHKTYGIHAIKLTEEPYSGIIFSYGKVSFDPDEENGTLQLHYEYELHDKAGKSFDVTEFETYIGDLLQELIHDGIEQNNLTYAGGVDENRTEDSSESDL